jgi:hypothetical protein
VKTFNILTKKCRIGKILVTFNAIAESAQEAFNFISNISQQKFAEETRVEKSISNSVRVHKW